MTETRKKIAFFDIDGTIFRKNLHFELINELVWMKLFPTEARIRLTEVYSGWLEHAGTYEDYRKALIDLYSKYIVGCSKEDVLRACKIVVPFHAKRTYIFAEKMIKDLRAEGYYLVAISGSPEEIVEEYNDHYLRFDRVYGSVYKVGADGRYDGTTSFEPSKNKGEVVNRFIAENGFSLEESYGIGDTESDSTFLELVEHPIAFNPNQNLKEAAVKNGWQIVVEKKDVIYEINPAGRKG